MLRVGVALNLDQYLRSNDVETTLKFQKLVIQF